MTHKILFLIFFITSFASAGLRGQNAPKDRTVDQILESQQSLSIRGYGELTYNQKFENGIRHNGELDVQRFVLFFGYRFNEKLQLITEVEMEHAAELFVEQAFANYKLSPSFQIRAGLLLIPMGIINEYHEPTTFHGVERPSVEKNVVPTTWRELGFGVTGLLLNTGFRYQLYLVNGMKSYDETGILRGEDGLRKGRQKGIQSIISHPNLSAKIDYFGIGNLKLGLSGYFGKTQSTLYDKLSEQNALAILRADSSVVNISMIGLDARYDWNAFEFRSALIYSKHGNTSAYNSFTDRDLGAEMLGWYVEAAYDLFSIGNQKLNTALLPFVRFEKYNTHLSTESIEMNAAFDRREITVGMSWRHGTSISYKTDIQFIKSKNNERSNQFNIGIGFWF